MKILELFLCFLIILSTITVSSRVDSPIGIEDLSEIEYNWLWEELQNRDLPGDIVGDDSLIWGEDLGIYYNSIETKIKLIQAESAFPDLVHYFQYGKSYLGNDLFGVRLSLDPDNKMIYTKYDSILIGAHHAREAITIMDVLLFMDRLIHDYYEGKNWAENLLSTTNLYIIPVFNPDGVDYLHINPWQRSNLQPFDGDFDNSTDDELEISDINEDGYLVQYSSGEYEGNDLDDDGKIGEDLPGGIDLNRNYAYEWGYDDSGSSSDPNDYLFRGDYPFQAPETLAYKQYVENQHFYMAMSLHSGIKAIIYPWGYTSDPSPDVELFEEITAHLQSKSYLPKWEEAGGYAVNGEWGDWMYGELDSIAMTIETFRGPSLQIISGGYGGIWDFFNPAANEIYDTSTDGVQNHLDYYFTVPREEYVIAPFQISYMSVNNQSGKFSIQANLTVDEEEIYYQFEELDEEKQIWRNISTPISLTKNNYSMALASPNNLNEQKNWRLYFGTQSQGYSYYFNFIGNLEIQFENNDAYIVVHSSTDGIISTSTADTPFLSSMTYLVIATIPIYLNKRIKTRYA